MTMEQAIKDISPADENASAAARNQWDGIAKPLGSLGLLEHALCRIAGATGSSVFNLAKRRLYVFCADNGVVAEGVTQTGSEVTAIVANNLCLGVTSVCRMAQTTGCEVFPVDAGMFTEVDHPNMLNRKTARGAGNIAKGPAMTREQAVAAIESGIALAMESKAQGVGILAGGEMGIGNTTSSSAVASVLLGVEPRVVTGRGAGLSTGGLRHKIDIIERAIDINRPDPKDPIDVLAKVGGFDIAAMCGLFLGGAVCRLPVIIDGLISGVAALCAAMICPNAKGYMLASHVSTEPAAAMVLERLDMRPVITAGMHLGEGSGAVALLPLLDMARAVYSGSASFSDADIESYQPLD